MGNTMSRLIVLTFATAVSISGTPVGAQTASGRFVSFDEFMQHVSAAGSEHYVGQLQNQVSSADAFEEMRQHLVRMYTGVHVAHSYILDSQYFDCIPIAEQPSVRLLGLRNVDTPPPRPAPLPGREASRAPKGLAVQVDPSRAADEFGNSIPCEAGAIPMRRVRLEELTRFRTLREFFQKGPKGAGQVPFLNTLAALTHKYAHAYRNVANHGGASFLNLWNPKVDTTQGEVFSLSQHWYTNYRGDGQVQTVEGGWQDYPDKYGVTKPILFIYWTADGYTSTGCYNLDCPGFVQVDPSIHLGGTFPKYSKLGGAQYAVKLQWQVFPTSGGRWWLYYDDTAVGYYPSTLYASGPLGTAASKIDYGGETVGSTAWPPMGSGRFPKKGFGYAAYQRYVYYVDTSDTAVFATLTPSQPSPSCYKIRVFNQTSDPDYRSYFFFGGPGGTGC